jgi:proline racemase
MAKSYSEILQPLNNWNPPSHWTCIKTIDVHTAGEPFRIIVGGYPELLGETILARRRYAREHLDHLRTALMWEPRGHREMYGCIVTPAVSPGADFGVVFMHNEGYSTMCGHGIIAVSTVAVQTGMVHPTEPETVIRIDTPAGLVTSYARVKNGAVSGVRLRNVPSFVVALDEVLDVSGLGTITYDLAFGGAFYVFVDSEQVGLKCVPEEARWLVEKGMMIKNAVMNSRLVEHPLEKDLSFLYGTVFIAPPIGEADTRNVCIFADGQIDRSPTGTGVSGRMAIHFARKEVKEGQPLVVESIIGSRFTGKVIESTTFGGYPAVITEIEGTAAITGRSEFLLDPDDPLTEGFVLR